jgi:hypothetical protein
MIAIATTNADIAVASSERRVLLWEGAVLA